MFYAVFLVICTTEKGNKLLNKITWKIRQIKMQQIFYLRKLQNYDAARK